MDKTACSNKGFSLVELLTTMAILSVTMGAVLTLSTQVQRREGFEKSLVQAQESGRDILDQILRDVRLVGYPRLGLFDFTLGWTPANSSKVAAVGFSTFTASTLSFEADVDNDGVVEAVSYQFSSGALLRSEVKKNTDGTIPGANYQLLANNVSALTFSYYRFSGGSWTATGVTSNNVQRVDVALTLLTSLVNPANRQAQQINLSESAVLRNQ